MIQATQCSAKTTRSYPYLLQGDSYESLHPEEYQWVQNRLVKTAPRVNAFLQAQLGKTLTPDQAKIKIGTVLGPGGKRMFLHGCGKKVKDVADLPFLRSFDYIINKYF